MSASVVSFALEPLVPAWERTYSHEAERLHKSRPREDPVMGRSRDGDFNLDLQLLPERKGEKEADLLQAKKRKYWMHFAQWKRIPLGAI